MLYMSSILIKAKTMPLILTVVSHVFVIGILHRKEIIRKNKSLQIIFTDNKIRIIDQEERK